MAERKGSLKANTKGKCCICGNKSVTYTNVVLCADDKFYLCDKHKESTIGIASN